MTTSQTLTDQIRNIDVRTELKKLDVLDLQERIDLPKIDLPKLEIPTEFPVVDLDDARSQLEDLRARFEEIVKELVGTAAGFAPVTRRELDELEDRVAAAEKAAKKAPKKAAARKTTKKPAAKKPAATPVEDAPVVAEG